MTQSELDATIAVLKASRQDFVDTAARLQANAGLYALWGDQGVWTLLGLGGYDGRPLYIGKSEDSFIGRPLIQHFQHERATSRKRGARATSPTGSSSPRRSLAALLRGHMSLQAIPRNPSKPGYFANYGLSVRDDERLTAWMRLNLDISTWASDGKYALLKVERAVKRFWRPPLNLDIDTPWQQMVRGSREQMASDARQWATIVREVGQ